EVAGKTGTAEVPPRPPHSWFVAFAPADDPQIAVAVLVENGGDGERAALPIARTLIEAHLGVEGRSVPDNQRPAVPQGAPDIQDILPEELQESLPEGIPGDPFSEN
ncbi:MAG: penicillin-binding transpeptidase domain-containing protein, partial [Actinomycetota bacterium]